MSTAPLAAAANVAAGTAPTAGASASGSALAVLDTAELKAQLAMIEQDDEARVARAGAALGHRSAGTLDPCTAAARQQVVRCSEFVSTLPLLKNLARPGVVGLRDANGRTVSVVLVGLGPTTATVHAGAQTLVARTSALRQRLARRLRHALAGAAGLRHGDRPRRIGSGRRHGSLPS